MCIMTASFLSHHQKTQSLLLQTVWFCLIAFKLSIWWFYWCAMLFSLPWGCRGSDEGTGETGEWHFSAVLRLRSIKKEKPQNKLANMKHKRKPYTITVSHNAHPKMRRVRPWSGTISNRVSLPIMLGLNISPRFECLNLTAHLIQWNLLSLPVSLSWYQDNSLWTVSVWF